MLPSAARPMFEWAMNMDGLGRAIYNNRQSRNNDAYTGGDNIPEIYKSAARFLYDATEGAVDWSPNTLYFFSNNYFDGMARLGAFTYNIANVATGEKEFDFKSDTLLLDAYLKAPSNYDARQFSEIEKEIKSIDQKLRAFKLPGKEEKYLDYIDNNPEAEFVVSAYNQFNGQLNGIREAANRARKDTTMSIKERQDLVRMYVKQQDMLKAMFTSQMEMYGIELD